MGFLQAQYQKTSWAFKPNKLHFHLNHTKTPKTTLIRKNPFWKINQIMFALRKTLKQPSAFTTAVHRLITTTTTANLPEPSTSAAYDDLITTAGRQRDLATVRLLLNQRYANGLFFTTNTFNFISTDNISVVDDLLKTLPDLKEGHCRKSAHDSLVARLCKLRLADAALRVAVELAGADARSFHPIISLLTRKKSFDEAWRVMEIMRSKGVARDVTCYNYFLTAYSVAGDPRSGVGVLKKMAEEGLKADARTYDALVLGACRLGRMDGAVAVMRRMVEDGVVGMHSTYAHVIGGLVKLGYCAQAVELVVSYGGKDKKLDEHNFGLLASRLMDVNKVDETKYVVDEMVKRDLEMGEKLKEFCRNSKEM